MELEQIINQYYDMLQRKKHDKVKQCAINIRKHILVNGCPEDDIIPENNNNNNGNHASSPQNQNQPQKLLTRFAHAVPKMRRIEDTLRGKLWRLALGVSALDAKDYKLQINKSESSWYNKIRSDTKRTFFTSTEYNSRVSEERLVRVLNSFVHSYNKPYCQGMDAIAAGLLYVMPELGAFKKNKIFLYIFSH